MAKTIKNHPFLTYWSIKLEGALWDKYSSKIQIFSGAYPQNLSVLKKNQLYIGNHEKFRIYLASYLTFNDSNSRFWSFELLFNPAPRI